MVLKESLSMDNNNIIWPNWITANINNTRCSTSDILNLTHEQKILEMLKTICLKFYPTHPSAFAITNWEFLKGERLEVNSNGKIILRRFTDFEDQFTKWNGDSDIENLINTSIYNWGWNWIPTSASKNWNFPWKYIITFEIPIEEAYKLASTWDITIGNLSECEIVLSPSIASKYLVSMNWNKNYIPPWKDPSLPDIIYI